MFTRNKRRRRKVSNAETPFETMQVPQGSRIKDANSLTGFEHMFEDGIGESAPGRFTRSLEFFDISYEDERKEIQDKVYEQFCMLHAYFPPGAAYQINLVNFPSPKKKVERYLPEVGMSAKYAKCHNDILEKKQRESRTDIVRRKFLTYSISATDYDQATPALAAMREGVSKQFKRMGVKTKPLSGLERMRVMHSLVRGDKEPFLFSYDRLQNTKDIHARDFVAPSWATYWPGDTFHKQLQLPGHLTKTYHIRDFGNDLSDRALGRIRALNIPMNISLTYLPQVKKETIAKIRSIIAAAQGEIYEFQSSLAKQNADITVLPPALEEKEERARELLEFLIDKDQLVNHFAGYITLYAPDKETMRAYEKALLNETGIWSLDVQELPLQQEQAFTSALPLANPLLRSKFRSLSTAESSNMIPWSSQNIQHNWRTSLLLGQDSVSNGFIFADPGCQKSPHMWVMGQTGSGKGMFMKSMLYFEILKYQSRILELRKNPSLLKRPTNKQDALPPAWIIFDFHNEYGTPVEAIGGKRIPISPLHDNCLNPLNISNAQGKLTRKEVVANTDAFLALTQSTLDRELTQQERSMIDRCLALVFEPHIGRDSRPILADLYRELKNQKSEVAHHLADAFEIFVEGSMNAFNGQTNVECDPYLTAFDCSELGKTMETFAMISMLQHVKLINRQNFQLGRITYLVVEEVQKLFDNDAALKVLDDFFSEERKFGLRLICVTQLPERVLDHPKARYFFQNSGQFVFLGNEPANAEKIAERFKLSETQEEAMGIAAPAGSGLVIVEGVCIHMVNEYEEGNILYDLWNTDPDKMLKENSEEAA